MKLSEYAKRLGIQYRTAWNHYKAGKIPGAYQIATGTIIVPNDIVEKEYKDYTVVYARVSSSENRDNLDSQAERVSSFCSARGWVVQKIVKEVGSGINDSRTKLLQLLKDPNVTRIVVEHKDRLTRFGFNYIEALLDGVEIIVINKSNPTNEEDIIEDFTSIITSFCARIYGRRRSRRKTECLIRKLKNGDDCDEEDDATS